MRNKKSLNHKILIMDKKTIIKGANQQNEENSFDYNKRRSTPPSLKKKTVVAGVGEPIPENKAGLTSDLAGFMVSYSNNGKPEHWILQYGQNTIGSSENNDIHLQEATVSSNHAKLVVRKNRTTQELTFKLSDKQTTNGTFVNGEDISDEIFYKCKNGDVITIGGYQLLLLVFDKEKVGLTKNESFQDTTKQKPVKSGGYSSRNYYQSNDNRTNIQQ